MSSSLIWELPISFFVPVILTKPANILLSKNIVSRYPCLVLDLSKKSSSFSLLILVLTVICFVNFPSKVLYLIMCL